MRHFILTLLIATISALGLYGQEIGGSKILIFRNTGEINIFNSDSISKVELSIYDTDSIAHDEFVSQVFHHKNNKVVAIPLAEIDSVAFGYRNIIEPKKGVRRLTDEEVEAISYFDGETLRYDSRLILKEGEIVYYDCITDNLPIGLCVKVKGVNDESGKHKAEVSLLDASDVFERYLVTGETPINIVSSKKKAEDYDRKPFEFELPEINSNGMRIEGKFQVNFDTEATEIVIDSKNKYYHAALKMFAYPRAELTVHTSEKQEIHKDFPEAGKPHIEIPALARAISFNFTFDAFLDVLAEAGIQYEYGQEYAISFEWTRKDGENYFSRPVITPTDPAATTQKTEVHLKGEIFAGVRADMNICTVFNIAGAGVELKFGPRIKSELSLGVIQELSKTFSQEEYAKGNITFQLGLKTETYYFHRIMLRPWEINKVKLPFESEIFADLFTHNLFPEFHTKAVLGRATAPIVQTVTEPEAVSISSFIEEKIPYPLNVSFEIADKNTDETLAKTEVIDTLEKEKEDHQTIYSEIIIPSELGKIDKDAILARPVINYKGYKVKTAPVNAAGDMIITPNICFLTGVSSYLVSGMTPVSQHSDGETTYIEGNLVGYGVKSDPRYKKRKFKMYEFIDISNPASCNGMHGESVSLYGVWTGKIANEDVSFTFTDKENGSYNGIPFSYTFNSPQRGGIAIQLSTGGSISFHIVDISDDSMTIIMKGSENEVFLNRNN